MNSRMNRPAMGIATVLSAQNKKTYWDFLNTFEARNLKAIQLGVNKHFCVDAEINGSHPINEAESGVGYYSDIIAPIAQSLDGFTRQNYIVLAGEYQGSEWVTSTGYFYGHFGKPLFGIPPSNKMAFLRFGEFHKMENGKITETYVYLGLAELKMHWVGGHWHQAADMRAWFLGLLHMMVYLLKVPHRKDQEPAQTWLKECLNV